MKETDFKTHYYISVLKTAGLRVVSKQVSCERAGLAGKGENTNHRENQQTETNHRFLPKKGNFSVLLHLNSWI